MAQPFHFGTHTPKMRAYAHQKTCARLLIVAFFKTVKNYKEMSINKKMNKKNYDRHK